MRELATGDDCESEEEEEWWVNTVRAEEEEEDLEEMEDSESGESGGREVRYLTSTCMRKDDSVLGRAGVHLGGSHSLRLRRMRGG
jgi:hypothetical protein